MTDDSRGFSVGATKQISKSITTAKVGYEQNLMLGLIFIILVPGLCKINSGMSIYKGIYLYK